MIFIDSHTHLYLNQFETDRDAVVTNAIEAGVRYMLLPNIDLDSVTPMLALCDAYPANCFPMLGLHPTSVDNNYKATLEKIEALFAQRKFIAIGESGIDLYWDKTYKEAQKEALRRHIIWADTYKLPLVIHSRDALSEIIAVLNEAHLPKVKGVFHCYPGGADTAQQIVKMGYMLGIGGVVTYNKTMLPEVIKAVGLDNIILETDAPYLPPVPHRGKRNESAYIPLIARKISEISGESIEQVARITSENAMKLFNIQCK